MPGWVAMVAKKGCSAVNIMDGGRGRGDQDGKSPETYMCPLYSVDVVTDHQGAAQNLVMISSTGTRPGCAWAGRSRPAWSRFGDFAVDDSLGPPGHLNSFL